MIANMEAYKTVKPICKVPREGTGLFDEQLGELTDVCKMTEVEHLRAERTNDPLFLIDVSPRKRATSAVERRS
jgi:hypothetical protein